jgi:hypothetical protein
VYYDFLLVQGELRKLIKNLKKWTAPERVGDFSLLTFPSSQWRGGGLLQFHNSNTVSRSLQLTTTRVAGLLACKAPSFENLEACKVISCFQNVRFEWVKLWGYAVDREGAVRRGAGHRWGGAS